MKNFTLGLIATLFTLSGTPARADSAWHTVLSCDNGAAVVDNISAFGRGGAGVGAQVVIRDPRIVYYFLQNHAAGEFVDGQWIGKSYFEPFQGGQPADALVSFIAQGIVVKSDGQTVTVTTGGANWTFRNCSRQ